jgi:hypothetical protein
MANLSTIFQGGFDSATVEPAKPRDFSVMPAGPYDAEITNADLKDTREKTGQYLEIEHTIVSPEQYAGRKVWARLNILNNNPKAQEIGREQLSAVCYAVGIPKLLETDHLFGKLLRIRLKVDRKDPNSPRNEVTGWEPHAGTTPPVNTARPAANGAGASAAAPTKKAPWQK